MLLREAGLNGTYLGIEDGNGGGRGLSENGERPEDKYEDSADEGQYSRILEPSGFHDLYLRLDWPPETMHGTSIDRDCFSLGK